MDDKELRAMCVPINYVLQGTMNGPAWWRELSNGHTLLIYLREDTYEGATHVAVHSPKFGFITWGGLPTLDARYRLAEQIADNAPKRYRGNWTREYNKIAPGARKQE